LSLRPVAQIGTTTTRQLTLKISAFVPNTIVITCPPHHHLLFTHQPSSSPVTHKKQKPRHLLENTTRHYTSRRSQLIKNIIIACSRHHQSSSLATISNHYPANIDKWSSSWVRVDHHVITSMPSTHHYFVTVSRLQYRPNTVIDRQVIRSIGNCRLHTATTDTTSPVSSFHWPVIAEGRHIVVHTSFTPPGNGWHYLRQYQWSEVIIPQVNTNNITSLTFTNVDGPNAFICRAITIRQMV